MAMTLSPDKNEHRSLRPLKLGVDIQIIATDTPRHQQQLFDYLSKHGLNSVEIVLIDELKKPSPPNQPMDIPAFVAQGPINEEKSTCSVM